MGKLGLFLVWTFVANASFGSDSSAIRINSQNLKRYVVTQETKQVAGVWYAQAKLHITLQEADGEKIYTQSFNKHVEINSAYNQEAWAKTWLCQVNEENVAPTLPLLNQIENEDIQIKKLGEHIYCVKQTAIMTLHPEKASGTPNVSRIIANEIVVACP